MKDRLTHCQLRNKEVSSKPRGIMLTEVSGFGRIFWPRLKKKKKKISRERVWPKAFHISLLLTYGSMFFILKSSSQNKGHMLSVFYSRRYDWKLHMQVLGHGLKVEKNTCPPPATFLHLTAGYMRWKELKQPTWTASWELCDNRGRAMRERGRIPNDWRTTMSNLDFLPSFLYERKILFYLSHC